MSFNIPRFNSLWTSNTNHCIESNSRTQTNSDKYGIEIGYFVSDFETDLQLWTR